MIEVAFGLGQREVRRTVVGDLSLENRFQSRARVAAALLAFDIVQRPGEGSWQQSLTRVLDSATRYRVRFSGIPPGAGFDRVDFLETLKWMSGAPLHLKRCPGGKP